VRKLLKCNTCARTYPESSLKWRCICGGHLVLETEVTPFLEDAGKLSFPLSQWRYRSSLPLTENSSIVSMGEGMTPLISGNWSGSEIFFKLDFLCPTGSYKDRGISFLVSRLRELGVKQLIEDSSGNAGASMAAYCARAGIECEIYVPEYTSQGKCIQIEMYGARLKKIPGTREDTTKAAENAADKVYYASHNWSPYFVHGIKTIAYELWEQSGGSMVDHIIVPAGQGSLVMGIYLGFSELKNSGIITEIPAIHAVQSERCAPLYYAYIRGLDKPGSISKMETIAEGISSAKPVKGDIVLDNIRNSGGSVITVGEEAIWDSFNRLASMGIYVEPTSAVVTAAFDKLIEEKRISGSERVVALLTGSGLKATDKLLHHKDDLEDKGI